MIFKNIVLALITVLVTLGCSMTVPVYSDQFESFDPSSYDSFRFIKPEPFSDTSDISENPVILTRISRSILGSLENLSLDEDQANPDLEISFAYGSKDDYRYRPTSFGFQYRRHPFYNATFYNYVPSKEFRLPIYVKESSSQEVVWYGSTRLPKSYSSDQGVIDEAVERIFSSYPKS